MAGTDLARNLIFIVCVLSSREITEEGRAVPDESRTSISLSGATLDGNWTSTSVTSVRAQLRGLKRTTGMPPPSVLTGAVRVFSEAKRILLPDNPTTA